MAGGFNEISRRETDTVTVSPEKTDAFENKEVKVLKLKTNNEHLAGKLHPETGVPYEKKKVSIDGRKIEGTFPQFEAKAEVRLPREKWKQGDTAQMTYCTKKLAENLEKNPELAEKFTPRQLQQIKEGNAKISNLTWHHKENGGVMQLVDADKHAKSHHTGGASIWGNR